MVFQDYNKEVLAYHTYINLLQNNALIHTNTTVELVAAEWSNLAHSICFASYALTDGNTLTAAAFNAAPRSFDLILGADLLYETEHYPTLLSLFDTLLSDTGSIMLVTKAYYYGNGGSLYEFQERVETDGRFAHQTLKVLNDKGSNRREVLLLRRV